MTTKTKLIYILGSMIIGIVSLLGVYLALIAGGVIDVERVHIVISSSSSDMVYDGTELKKDEWQLVGGNLQAGDTAIVAVTGSRTEAGKAPNYLSATIIDLNGTDVTSSYEIEYQPGTLTVVPRSLEVTVASSEKVYDGTELVFDDYALSGGTLVDGHVLEAVVSGSRINVGTSANEISCSIKTADGKDVTANYAVDCKSGNLTVTRRPITLSSLNATKLYDGTPLTNEEWTIDEATPLVDGHHISVDRFAAVTNVGEADNTFRGAVLTADNEVITSNYYITYEYGTLTVTPRELTVTTGGATKQYDGTPLASEVWSLKDGFAPLEGHTVRGTTTGTITDAGVKENTITCSVVAEDGSNMTGNYKFTLEAGVLEITKRPLTVTTGSATKLYDGTPLTKDESSYAGELASGQEIIITCTSSLTKAGSLSNGYDASIKNELGNNVTANYEITSTLGVLTVEPLKYSIISANAEKTYDGQPLIAEEYTESGALAIGHTVSVVFAAPKTAAGEYENKFTATMLDADGIDVTENYDLSGGKFGKLLITPITITVKTESDAKQYDGTPLTNSNYQIIAGSVLAAHNLAIVITGSQTSVGESPNNFSATVTDENGQNVTQNYLFSSLYRGTLTVEKRVITITSGSHTKAYDGTPLTDENYTISNAVMDEHNINVTTSGTITKPGTAANTISYEITDSRGNAVNELYYEVVLNEGTLTVTKKSLSVISQTSSKTYDGTALTNYGYEISGIVGGQVETVSFSGSQTNVGESDNTFTVTVKDALSVDVTDYYEITQTFGTLTVNKADIYLTTQSAQKYYDGTPLTMNSGYVVEGVVSGQHESLTSFATITNAGTIENSCVLRVFDANGYNVTGNYNIVSHFGKLTVLKVEVTVTAGSASKYYDGKALTCATYTSNDVPVGFTLSAVMSGSITDVGTAANAVTSVQIANSSGTNVTANFNITKISGELKVFALPLTVQATSARQDFDGTELTSPSASYTTVADGQNVQVSVVGSQTTVGTSENTVKSVLVTDSSGKDVTYNYDIQTEAGSLTVSASAPIVLDESGSLSGEGATLFDAYRLSSDYSGTVYLRYKSFGNFYVGDGVNSSSWGAATEYGSTFGDNYSMNYLGGALQKLKGATAYKLDITPVEGGNYVLPYYLADGNGGYLVQQSDIKYDGSTDSPYSVYYYPTASTSGGLGAYATAELSYKSYVYSNYLSILSASTATYLQGIIDSEGFDRTSGNIVYDVASYVSNAAFYNKDYDTSIDRGDTVVNFFQRKEGVCRHYASAATLLYRQLGIPARYVIGYLGGTIAGKVTTINASAAHAWVEVYIDGFGWQQVEVTSGSIDTRETLFVKPENQTMKFDGAKTLYPTNELQGLAALTQKGYTYEATVSGRITTIGTAYSTIQTFTLYDQDGNDVTDDFNITFNQGTLTVYAYDLYIVTDSYEKVYDGKQFAASVEAITSCVGLLSNHRVATVTLNEYALYPGLYENNYSLTILDENNNDVTAFYGINASFGTLTVTEKAFTIVSGSQTKPYDGSALICHEYTLYDASGNEMEIGAAIADGDTLVVTFSGTKTTKGTVNNTFTFTIKDASGKDVSNCYAVTMKSGKLKVT